MLFALLAPFLIILLDRSILEQKSIFEEYITPLFSESDAPIMYLVIPSLWVLYLMTPSFLLLYFLTYSSRTKIFILGAFVFLWFPICLVAALFSTMSLYHVYP